MRNFIERHTFLLLLLIHIFVALLRCLFVSYGNVDLHTEEAQYWTWSQHLDWSYYSKPPMVAYLNYFSEVLFGHSEFSVRINAIVLGFLTALVTYFFARDLFQSKKKGFVASLLVYAMPFSQSAALFFSTDAPLLFFATLAMYLGWLAISLDKWKYWLGFSIALGLGYLSKYAMLFFLPTTLLFLFLYNRKTLFNRKLYYSILLSLVFLIPVFIWNFQHDFIGLKHIIHLSGNTPNSVYPFSKMLKNIAEYFAGQLAIISPLFLLFYIGAFKKYKTTPKVLYLALPAVFVWLIFFVIAITRRSGANVNWTMFAYVGLPVLLSHYIVEMKKFRTFGILYGITIGLFVLALNLQSLDALGKLFPPKADPLKRMVGWEEIAQKIDSLENVQHTEKLFVFADSYHIASELRFYNYPKTNYFYANTGNRMTQFDLWKGIEQFSNQGYTGIFVSRVDISKKNYAPQKPKALPKDIAAAFDAKYDYHTYIYRYREKPITQFHIYVLRNFKELATKTENY